jgi:hypothetical protein
MMPEMIGTTDYSIQGTTDYSMQGR